MNRPLIPWWAYPLLIAGIVAAIASAADARYCSSPNCAMCARLFGPLPGYRYVDTGRGWGRVVRDTGAMAASPETAARHLQSLQTPKASNSFDPTPPEAVAAIIRWMDLQPADHLTDLGCGDGRVLLSGKSSGAQVTGVEINPATAKRARAQGSRVVVGDATKHDLADASVIYVYLYPPVLERIRWETFRGRLIVSYCHELPIPCKRIRLGDHEFFFWTPEMGRTKEPAWWVKP